MQSGVGHQREKASEPGIIVLEGDFSAVATNPSNPIEEAGTFREPVEEERRSMVNTKPLSAFSIRSGGWEEDAIEKGYMKS